jgi:GNAT superfamily N-acetyltransferase
LSGDIKIDRYQTVDRDAVLAMSLSAWEPVFQLMESDVPTYVFNAFYPDGWQARQLADIETFLDNEADPVWVAKRDDVVIGWIGGRVHRDDRMGEIYILAVSPDHQRKGISRSLMDHLTEYMRDQNLSMMMVETGDDRGHAASRATYESAGFERWPVARYFRKL